MLELLRSGAWGLSARAIARPRVQKHLRCHQLRRTSPILGLGYGARERRHNPLACNTIPQKRELPSHLFTNLAVESWEHIYKKPDFSRTASMRTNRLIVLCKRLYIATGWRFGCLSAGSPKDSGPQTQLVLIRKQLYNRWCKDHPAAVEAACAKITGQNAL